MVNVSKCKRQFSILPLIDNHEQYQQNGPRLLPKSTTSKILLVKNSHYPVIYQIINGVNGLLDKQLMILFTNPFELFKRIFYRTNSCPQASD